MRITLTNVFVTDQQAALPFYTGVLGFEMGPVVTALFDDTCGNLIQIASPAPPPTDQS